MADKKRKDALVARGDEEGQKILQREINTETRDFTDEIEELENEQHEKCKDAAERARVLATRYNSVSVKATSGTEQKTLLPKKKEFLTDLYEFRNMQKIRVRQLRDNVSESSRRARTEEKKGDGATDDLMNHEPTMAETLMAIKDLNKDSSAGHMKLKVEEITAMLGTTLELHNKLHQLMWRHTWTPERMRQVSITPVLKKGKRPEKAASYRPVSVTPALTKAFEKIVHWRILEKLKEFPTIFQRQCGWQKKRGTLEAIFEALHHIRVAQSKKRCVGFVKLDLRKFFDTIDRDKLWIKMEEMGFGGKLLQWLKMHMDGVRYFVKVHEKCTEPCTHEIGLPQGSILSPILAAIFTEGLPDVIMKKHDWLAGMPGIAGERSETKVFANQFADDNSIVITGHNEADINKEKKRVIRRCKLWAKQFSLQFDMASGKTEHMTIRSWKTHGPHEVMDPIEIEGEGLQLHPPERTGEEKMGTAKHVMRHLGVLFNATASLEESINAGANAALRNAAAMSIFDAWKKIDGCDYETTTKTKRTVFHQLVQSQLQFVETLSMASDDKRLRRKISQARGRSLKKVAGIYMEASERDAALLEGEFSTKNHMQNEIAQATLRILSSGKCNAEMKQCLAMKGGKRKKTGRRRTQAHMNSPVLHGMQVLNTTLVGPVLSRGNVTHPSQLKLPTWNRKLMSYPEQWRKFGKPSERSEEQQEQAREHAEGQIRTAAEESQFVIITDGSSVGGAMGWAFSIYRTRDGQLEKELDVSDVALGTLGDSFMAESMAQLKAWEKMNEMAGEWGVDENTTTTLISDSQSTLQSLNTTNPNYAITAKLQWELARHVGRVKCRWIPAHCGCEKQDEVDEKATEAAKENVHDTATVMKMHGKRKNKKFMDELVLELQVAKRIVKKTLMERQVNEWKKMKTKMGEMMDFGENESPPKAMAFQHPVAKIASRVNRMRTQKTRFQQRKWKKTFCKVECIEEFEIQCDRCAECGNGGRWTFEWTKCQCEDEKGQRVNRDIEHMLTKCTATEEIVRARNKLWNFHVRSLDKRPRVENIIEQANVDSGERKEPTEEEVKWQRMLIPIGMGHLGQRWHVKNNELIYELRREHVRAQRQQRIADARPPPKPPPEPASSGVKGRGEKRRGSVASENRRSKRAKKAVHKDFFVC